MKFYKMIIAMFAIGLIAICGGTTTTALAAGTPTWTDYAFTASTSAPYTADLGPAANNICGLTSLSAAMNESTPVSTGINLFVSGGDWQVSATISGTVRCFASSDFTVTPSSLSVVTVPVTGSGYVNLSHAANNSDCLLGQVSGQMLNLVDASSVTSVLGQWNGRTAGSVLGGANCLTYSGFKALTASTITAGTAHTSCGANCKDYSLASPSLDACFITGVEGDMSGDAVSNSLALVAGSTQDLQVTGTSTMIINIACLPF